jgi:hypothetical protein
MEESPQLPERPQLNPELKVKAKLPSLNKLRAWLDSKEAPTTRQRVLEHLTCGVIAGIVLWYFLP